MGRLATKSILLVIVLLGMFESAGCIYIPTFGITEGKNVSEFAGDSGSKAPLRVGLSTGLDVINLLGEPKAVTDDSLLIRPAEHDPNTLTYHWQSLQGYGGMLLGPCSGLGWFKDYHSLTFKFSDQSVIDAINKE